MNHPINILVTINSKYLVALLVMMRSMTLSNPGETFNVYLMYSELRDDELKFLRDTLARQGHALHPVQLDDQLFRDAKINFHFSKEIYYRLMVSEALPQDVDRVLYLDPDIIVNNPVRPLYDMELGDHFFAMAGGVNEAMELLWKTRLNMPLDKKYLNTGVLLFNLVAMRETYDMAKVLRFIDENEDMLLWPDQDVINVLFHDKTVVLDPDMYNYDARYHALKMLRKGAKAFFKNQVVFVHYMGPLKPWKANYLGMLKDVFDKAAKQTELPPGVELPLKD